MAERSRPKKRQPFWKRRRVRASKLNDLAVRPSAAKPKADEELPDTEEDTTESEPEEDAEETQGGSDVDTEQQEEAHVEEPSDEQDKDSEPTRYVGNEDEFAAAARPTDRRFLFSQAEIRAV